MSAIVIARLTFREASRRWVLWAALLLGLVFIGIYALGVQQMYQDMENSMSGGNVLMRNEVYNFFVIAGLYVVNFLTLIMAVLTSVDTLSGEIASGTIHTLVSKPVRRWEILLGKWLGFLVMLTLYLLLMAGGVMLTVWMIIGYTVPNSLQGLGLIWLNMILFLTISLLGGTWLSTLANGVFVFGLYGIAFIGGWIEQFGSFLNNQTAINIGIVSSLLIPSEALWKRAAFEMQSPVVSILGGFSFFTSNTTPSNTMTVYAVLFTAVALFLAIRNFQKRDL